jgi:hypothetical protein
MLINYIKLLSSGLLNCITYGRLVWVLVFNWWLCANVFKKNNFQVYKIQTICIESNWLNIEDMEKQKGRDMMYA